MGLKYYTDGEYEYRIARGERESGTTVLIRGRHGKQVPIPHLPGTRVWVLHMRPVAPPRIVFTNFCSNPLQTFDGSVVRKGKRTPPNNPWEDGGCVYLPNKAGWAAAKRRLLGPDFRDVGWDKAAAKRLRAEAADATIAAAVDLGADKK